MTITSQLPSAELYLKLARDGGLSRLAFDVVLQIARETNGKPDGDVKSKLAELMGRYSIPQQYLEQSTQSPAV